MKKGFGGKLIKSSVTAAAVLTAVFLCACSSNGSHSIADISGSTASITSGQTAESGSNESDNGSSEDSSIEDSSVEESSIIEENSSIEESGSNASDNSSTENSSSEDSGVDETGNTSTDSSSEDSGSEERTHTHTYIEEVTEPTCAKQGYTTYTCTTCGDSYIDDYTAATGHNYKEEVTEPTCTKQGYTTYTCTTCGDSYIDDYTAATGHSYGEWEITKQAACTEEGEKQCVCSKCGDIQKETIEATGHSYVTTEVAATVDSRGYTEYICRNCGDSSIVWGEYLYTPELKYELVTSEDGNYYSVTGITDGTVTEVYIPSYYLYGGEYLPVKEIEANAFSGNTSITKVVIGAAVETIAESAFSGCSSLTYVNIPASLTTFGYHAFYNCVALTEIYYAAVCADAAKNADDTSADAFKNAGNTNGITLTVANTVQSLPAYLFYVSGTANYVKITQIIFEEGSVCTDIGQNAFFFNNALKKVVLPTSLTTVGMGAFYVKSSYSDLYIYYMGTEEQWSEITFETGNTTFKDTTVYYYSEILPEDAGNYWYYSPDGEITLW